MNNIKVEEVLQLINPKIIDIREKYYYNQEHINIPYYNLLNNFTHYLSKIETYYLYCETGEQSKEISTRLNRFGYHTYNIIGGYQEYLKVFGK